jgi:hypothetical protein
MNTSILISRRTCVRSDEHVRPAHAPWRRMHTARPFILFFAAGAVALYLGGLYYLSAYSVSAQEGTDTVEKLTIATQTLEAKVQQTRMALPEIHREIIEQMPEISSLVYIGEERSTVSRANPPSSL